MSSNNDNYFCHQCGVTITPLMVPNPTCPHCHEDFVEEIDAADDPRTQAVYVGPAAPGSDGEVPPNIADLMQMILGGVIANNMPPNTATGTHRSTASTPPVSIRNSAASFGTNLADALNDMVMRQRQQAHDTMTQAVTAATSAAASAFNAASSNNRSPQSPPLPHPPQPQPADNDSGGSGNAGMLGRFAEWLGARVTGSSSSSAGSASTQSQPPPSDGATASTAAQPASFVRFSDSTGSNRSAGPHTRVWVYGSPDNGSGFTFQSSFSSGPVTFSSSVNREGSQAQQAEMPLANDPFLQLIQNMLFSGNDIALAQLNGGIVGEPGDYVTNEQTFDDIISQLMERTGLRARRGLTDETIDALAQEKIQLAQNGDKSDEEAPSCAICTESYEQDEMVRRLACDHRYHDPCIRTWLKRSSTCPVCRAEVRSNSSPHANTADSAQSQLHTEPLD